MTDQFPHPYTEENGLNFIRFATSEHPIRIFAIAVEDEAVGGIGIHPQKDIHRKNAELGYWLAEPYWGHGIVSAAIQEMLEFAFLHFDINRVFARPFGSNLASQKVLEKNGFVLEAKMEKVLYKKDRYEDEWIYAFRKYTSN